MEARLLGKCKIRVAPRGLPLAQALPALALTQGIWPPIGVAKCSQHHPGSRVPLMTHRCLQARRVFQDQFWRFKESNLVFSRKWRDSLIKSKWIELSGIVLYAFIPLFCMTLQFCFTGMCSTSKLLIARWLRTVKKVFLGLNPKIRVQIGTSLNSFPKAKGTKSSSQNPRDHHMKLLTYLWEWWGKSSNR